jgi:Na+/H+ antiporter NhaD/arsenite permease-like protein
VEKLKPYFIVCFCRKETKEVIKYMQLQVQCNPLKGFWLVSAAAFLVAPFLTNDGVCLLFVELILDAFDATKSISNSHLNTSLSSPEQRAKIVLLQEMPLETGDAIYFLLTLACSANIGSALTYTGHSLFNTLVNNTHKPLTN